MQVFTVKTVWHIHSRKKQLDVKKPRLCAGDLIAASDLWMPANTIDILFLQDNMTIDGDLDEQ